MNAPPVLPSPAKLLSVSVNPAGSVLNADESASIESDDDGDVVSIHAAAKRAAAVIMTLCAIPFFIGAIPVRYLSAAEAVRVNFDSASLLLTRKQSRTPIEQSGAHPLGDFSRVYL